MPTLNRVQLIGHLGKDPETRFIPSGKKVTHFSLAVNNHWKSEGDARTSTDWFSIEAWGRPGEICSQYLHKGSLVFIEGRLKTDKYEDKAGETNTITRVVLQTVQMLDRKAEAAEPVDMIGEEAAAYEV